MQHNFMKCLQMASALKATTHYQLTALVFVVAITGLSQCKACHAHMLISLHTHSFTHGHSCKQLLPNATNFYFSLSFHFPFHSYFFRLLRNCKNKEEEENSAGCVRSSVWRWRFKLKISKQAKDATKLYMCICMCGVKLRPARCS